MKFKGIPNNLVRITKISKTLVRKIPKSIRFDENGVFETENPYLIKRLSVKFETIEEVVEEVVVLEKVVEVDESEIRLQAKEAGIKSWHVKSIDKLIKELEV
jgi:hypothetical protein